MNLANRIKLIRNELKLTQAFFAEKIGLKQAAIGLYENGQRNIGDRVITDICREFNVNEDWLRNGNGEMFIEPDTFSLDEYVKQRGATDFELSLVQTFVKSYFGLPEEFRDQIITDFKNSVLVNMRNDSIIKEENSIDKELEAYRKELEAEEKGATLSAIERLSGA